MTAVHRAFQWLRGRTARVPLLGHAFKAVDRLRLYFVAEERYTGRRGWHYLTQYSAVILPQTHGRVLDLGCGHGYVTYEIACRADVTEVVGIDRIADFRCPHPKITYRTQDLAADPRLPGGFDVVVATEFIEHIPECAFLALLPEICNALRDGGHFIGSTPPNPTPDDTFSGSPYHRREYQPEVLQAHLERYFTGVHIELHGTAVMTWLAQKPVTS
jgi:SAM-dependent methyltransferase